MARKALGRSLPCGASSRPPPSAGQRAATSFQQSPCCHSRHPQLEVARLLDSLHTRPMASGVQPMLPRRPRTMMGSPRSHSIWKMLHGEAGKGGRQATGEEERGVEQMKQCVLLMGSRRAHRSGRRCRPAGCGNNRWCTRAGVAARGQPRHITGQGTSHSKVWQPASVCALTGWSGQSTGGRAQTGRHGASR